jgi:xanthine dehydrogenase YagT iron-sulfur-binding subunit
MEGKAATACSGTNRKATMSDHHDPPAPERDSDATNVSRRGFLKGFGAGTVATSLLSPAAMREAAAAENGGWTGPGELPISLKINGTTRELRVEPRATLLDALRNRLDVTGPKKVCDRGTCGACTVLVDGQPAYSCCMLALEAEGRAITTVEGLGTPEKMNAVQKAFVQHDAQQCGFCTPGFVTAATGFVRKNPNATAEEICKGLGGNLCRCGTYAGMLLVAADLAKSKGGV